MRKKEKKTEQIHNEELEKEEKKTEQTQDEKLEKKEKKVKTKRKIDKSDIAIKIVATFLTIAMILPIVASTVFYIMGE